MEKYCHKEVQLSFFKKSISFLLSQGLFSSNSIDSGSHFLLKTLCTQLKLEEVNSVLDVGCGTGVLGISLKTANPNADVYLQDRDALAVSVSKINALKNNLKIQGYDSLMLEEGLGTDQHYDLIVTNIPAKAGGPVLEDFILRSGKYLNKGGRIAMVIVHTLADFAEETIMQNDLKLLHKERNRQHTVFHFSGFTKEEYNFENYIRYSSRFLLEDTPYSMDTVYNLPDFDIHGFQLIHGAKQLDQETCGGKALFWNPGQGHLATFLSQKKGNQFSTITAASRDRLQVQTTLHNIEKNASDLKKSGMVLPAFESLKENIEEKSLNFVSVTLSPIPQISWQKDFWETADFLLKDRGQLHILGKSSDFHPLLKDHKGFTVYKDKKHKGQRSVILKRSQGRRVEQ